MLCGAKVGNKRKMAKGKGGKHIVNDCMTRASKGLLHPLDHCGVVNNFKFRLLTKTVKTPPSMS